MKQKSNHNVSKSESKSTKNLMPQKQASCFIRDKILILSPHVSNYNQAAPSTHFEVTSKNQSLPIDSSLVSKSAFA